MGCAPSLRIRFFQPLAEPLAHQRMGVKRIRRRGVLRRQQPHVAQARECALPWAFIEIDDCVGEPRDRRLAPQRSEAIAARRPVGQPDHLHDGVRHWLAGEPLCLV